MFRLHGRGDLHRTRRPRTQAFQVAGAGLRRARCLVDEPEGRTHGRSVSKLRSDKTLPGSPHARRLTTVRPDGRRAGAGGRIEVQYQTPVRRAKQHMLLPSASCRLRLAVCPCYASLNVCLPRCCLLDGLASDTALRSCRLLLPPAVWSYGRKPARREEILEAFIGTQFREHRVDLQVHQPNIALFVSLLQPLECLVLVAESGVNRRDRVGRT